jgi:histidine ammonia-lyase
METYKIDHTVPISLETIASLLNNDIRLELSTVSKQRISDTRAALEKKIADSPSAIYGINTGFGSLYNQSIPDDKLNQLQENLLKSHACGTGDRVPDEIVRLMLFLKIYALSHGNSGIRLETVEKLIELYNRNILPVVFQQGSLGASGDLAPLAHMALPLIGRGRIVYNNTVMFTEELVKKGEFSPITLSSKEGLALINGTQFILSYASFILVKLTRLFKFIDIAASLSIDAFDARLDPFIPQLQEIRPHNGQIETAQNIRHLLADSEIIAHEKEHLQDPYSFRCIPQVVGASRDAYSYVKKAVETELNAVTDNPTFFPEDDLIVSGGNFHAQPLAIPLDVLAIAMSELGNIAERRIYQLISGKRHLPSFLVANPGINSGFMIPQYTAASIVSQNKQLATPASVDSIESSQGQEDHVSMGANAATKAYRVYRNIERLIAFEMFTASQALKFREPEKTSPYLQSVLEKFRKTVPFVENDTEMYKLIEHAIDFVKHETV